jgi:acyl carrier protein
VNEEQKVMAALKKLGVPADQPLTAATSLRDDLGLDSANLVELTVLVHSMYGIDLGRKAAEHNALPTTIGDLIALMATS